MECRSPKEQLDADKLAIVIPRGPPPLGQLHRTRHCQIRLTAVQPIDSCLSPLPAKEMSCLYFAFSRASHHLPRSAAFPSSIRRAINPYPNCSIRYYSAVSNMSDLFVELTAPNGRKYQQPRGLFINNEFVKSKSGETITSINPRYAPSCDL